MMHKVDRDTYKRITRRIPESHWRSWLYSGSGDVMAQCAYDKRVAELDGSVVAMMDIDGAYYLSDTLFKKGEQ